MPDGIDNTTLTALASTGSAIVGALAVVFAMVRSRSHKDGKIFDAIHEGDHALDERLRSQETLCSGVRGEVLTKLEALEKSQAEQNRKLDKLVGWGPNGEGGRQ